jgi:hypothetical protein
MFPARDYTFSDLTSYCQSTYGLTPDPNSLNIDFGGADMVNSVSNVVFSNGALDPFNAGGFLPPSAGNAKWTTRVLENEISVATSNDDRGVTLLLIQEAAHHLDLRSTNPLDPQAVTTARQIELQAMEEWIENFVPPSASASATTVAAASVSPAKSEKPEKQDLLYVPSHSSWVHDARADSTETVEISLHLRASGQSEIERLHATIFDPSSPQYLNYPHHREDR